jgi:arylsulfatase A-like enzyme
MSLSTAGFGYFLSTGSPADWQIFKYTVSNFTAVRELVAGSVNRYALLLLAAPWIWSALAWWLVSDGGHRVRGTRNVRPSTALALTPVILFLVLVPPVHVSPSVQSGSLYRIVRTAAADVMGGGELSWDVDPAGHPGFDATGLRFDRTDSTTTPNIVVILMESVRRRSTTPYSPNLPTMPFLDSLGRAGALVEDMSAVVSYTNKALIPIYAGIYPSPGRDFVEVQPDAIPAKGLPALLSPLGYRSAFFTSATMEFERKDLILKNLGFEYMVGAEGLELRGFHEKAYFGYEDRAATKPALEWARDVSEDGKPFFLNILTLTSHHPYDVPDSFEKKDYGTPDAELNAYFNSLRYTDDFLREFLTEMSSTGLADNTVYFILGDHGEAFREHMEKTHGNVVWDEALTVPAVIYGPDLIPSGPRISGARQHIDLLPTVADLLNTTLSGGYLPGRSLFTDVPDDRTLYHHSLDDGRTMALRRDSMKFIYSYRHAPTRVFNYITDPEERRDLASRYSDDYLSAVELELLIWRKRVKEAYAQRPER